MDAMLKVQIGKDNYYLPIWKKKNMVSSFFHMDNFFIKLYLLVQYVIKNRVLFCFFVLDQ